jgi:hypothetical protein
MLATKSEELKSVQIVQVLQFVQFVVQENNESRKLDERN